MELKLKKIGRVLQTIGSYRAKKIVLGSGIEVLFQWSGTDKIMFENALAFCHKN